MKSTKKDLPKSQIELTITITQEEYEPHLKKAAEKISQKIKIKGFRKGHVPYDIVEKEAGE
ncbi:MAG: trigger factor family protein, partial [Candidatus Magasanikbacteria bacterium]|nr:trigger factor family protein [Candidatus Magasanikbacteria bacterium]